MAPKKDTKEKVEEMLQRTYDGNKETEQDKGTSFTETVNKVMDSNLPESMKRQLLEKLMADSPFTSPVQKEKESDERDKDILRLQAAVAKRIGSIDKICIDDEMAGIIAGGHVLEGELKTFVGNILTVRDPVGIKAVAALRRLSIGVPVELSDPTNMMEKVGREVVWRMLVKLASALEAFDLQHRVYKDRVPFLQVQETVEAQCDPENTDALKSLKAINQFGKQTNSGMSQGFSGQMKRARDESAPSTRVCFRCGQDDHLASACTNQALPPMAQKALKASSFKAYEHSKKR